VNKRRNEICFTVLILLLGFSSPKAHANIFRTNPYIFNPPLSEVQKRSEEVFGKAEAAQMRLNEKIFVEEALKEYMGRAEANKIFDGARYYKSEDPLALGEQTRSWREEAAIFLHGTKIPKTIYMDLKEEFYHYFKFKNSKISFADQIARQQVYQLIADNWNVIQTTVFAGDYNIPCDAAHIMKCEAFRDVMSKKIKDNLFFSYEDTMKDKENFVFEFQGEDGYVMVSKDLKKSTIVIGISYYNDHNQVDPRTKKYVTDVQMGLAPPPQPASSGAPASDSNSGNPAGQ
jgi:hypothetical protein